MRASLLTSLPCMMAEPTAFSWLCLQESLLKAPNTVEGVRLENGNYPTLRLFFVQCGVDCA